MVEIEQNPLYFASVGGLVIGLATSLNYAFRGSVTGMSGMVYRMAIFDKKQMPINLSIIGGMLLVSGVFFNVFKYETHSDFTPFGPASEITTETSQIGFALAGLLVGLGTKLSNGCTSGHGLCGLARFSFRSFVAVMSFLVAGFAIATIKYHAGGLGPFTESRFSPVLSYQHEVSASLCIALGVILPVFSGYWRLYKTEELDEEALRDTGMNHQKGGTKEHLLKDQIVVFAVGLLFGLGLLVAGMVRRTNIIYFLALGKDWNPSLAFVLGCGLAVNLIVFTYFLKLRGKSLFGEELFNPSFSSIDRKLVIGAVLFGLGWGVGGLCPGPAIMQSSVFTVDVHLIWFPFCIIGQFIANRIVEETADEPSQVAPSMRKQISDQQLKPGGTENSKKQPEMSKNNQLINMQESSMIRVLGDKQIGILGGEQAKDKADENQLSGGS